MKYNLTVNEILDLIDEEIITLKNRQMDASNKRDAIKKMNILTSILLNLNEGEVISGIEGCRGDGDIRQGTMLNAGSLVEALVRWALGKTACKTEGGKDCGRYEIKTSLTAKSLSTQADENVTIVVNQIGVWKCYKKDIDTYTIVKSGKKRFPHNQPCGIQDAMTEKIAEALGIGCYEW